jgi:hypothetical protein
MTTPTQASTTITTPIFLILGPPAVGKSTTSRALAASLAKSVHIPVDDLRNMVVSGLELPGAVWNDGLVRQIALARANAASMALAYRDAGFAAVIDDFWDANHATDYAALLGHAEVHRIVLLPVQATAHERNFRRSGDSVGRAYIDEGIRMVYQQLTPNLTELAREGWLIVDTTAMTVGETVTAIRAQTARAA